MWLHAAATSAALLLRLQAPQQLRAHAGWLACCTAWWLAYLRLRSKNASCSWLNRLSVLLLLLLLLDCGAAQINSARSGSTFVSSTGQNPVAFKLRGRTAWSTDTAQNSLCVLNGPFVMIRADKAQATTCFICDADWQGMSAPQMNKC
jgi:hypothetical protein